MSTSKTLGQTNIEIVQTMSKKIKNIAFFNTGQILDILWTWGKSDQGSHFELLNKKKLFGQRLDKLLTWTESEQSLD